MQICFFITRKLYTANVEKSIRVLEIRGMVEKNGNQDLLASEMLKKFPTKKYTLGGVSIQILKNDANTFSVLMELLILDLWIYVEKSWSGDFMDMSGDYMDEPMIFVDERGQILNK